MLDNRKLANEELQDLAWKSLPKRKSRIIVILDNVRSLNNIGSIFRTSDAFLIKRSICGSQLHLHKDIHKTALGATETVEWEYVKTAQRL